MTEQATNEQSARAGNCAVSWEHRHRFDDIVAFLESVGITLNDTVCNIGTRTPVDREQIHQLHVSTQLLIRLVAELDAIGPGGEYHG